MRVSGLSSGMDIDSIVTDLMKAQRAPLEKLQQNKTKLDWKREEYRTINSKIVDFRNNKLANYRNRTDMLTMSTTVTGNTDALTAKATASANGITMDIKVISLATSKSFSSKESLSGASKATTLGSLSSVGNFSLMIDGKDMEFSSSDTISTVISRINKESDGKVVAKWDDASSKLLIETKATGAEANKIVFSASQAFQEAFKIKGTADVKDSGAVNAQNAVLEVNNSKVEQASNTFVLNGVEITLNSVTGAGDKNTIVKTQSDPSKMLDTIKSFIKDYNNLIDYLNTKVGEEKYRDYAPLTDDQKKEMEEEDIKRWEEKAKSGLMKNDDIISTTLSNLRMAVSGTSDDNGNTIFSYGITTGKWYDGGKLVIEDEDKLKQMIEDNPEQIMDLLSGKSTDTPGIFDKMYSTLNTALNSLSKKAGTNKYTTELVGNFTPDSLMGKELTDLDGRITAMTTKLTNLETRYYQQFSTMETAINKFNAQSSSLTSFMNS